MQKEIAFILSRYNKLLEAFKATNILILPNGEIEHYYTQSSLDYLNITEKDKVSAFNKDRDYILECSNIEELKSKYKDLVDILVKFIPQIRVDLGKHLKYQIIEWIQTVQRSISKGDISDITGLKSNAKINYTLYSQIITIENLIIEDDKKFVCTIKINKSIDKEEKNITFSESTIPHNFNLDI
jgi:hypothetical protein